jgi:DNA-binding transcriptional MerR regulator
MISAVAEMYGIHPQTLRLYECEGSLNPSRTEGNTRLYTGRNSRGNCYRKSRSRFAYSRVH